MMSLPRSVVVLTKRASICRKPLCAIRFLSSVNVAVDDASTGVKVKNAKKTERHTAKNLPTKPDPLNVHLAITKMRELAWAKFDETVEIAVNLGVDPRKPNQSVKGVAKLPHGNGKKVRVAVFAQGADATAAMAAGADIVGAEDLVSRIQKGDLAFDTVIATPEMMPMVSKIGRILGPRGMMPNPRMGTVTKEVGKAIIAAKRGSVQFRVEKAGIVHVGIGKLSFSDSQLLDNVRSFMVAVSDTKPEGLKSKYIMSVSISSTMGPGVALITQNVDPSNPTFMLDPSKLGSMK